jgi:hypothetical protein
MRANASPTRSRSALEASKGVEQIEMRRGIEEHLMFVLPVKVDELRGCVPQRRGGNEGAVHEGATAPALR